jgi:hypothetical protein
MSQNPYQTPAAEKADHEARLVIRFQPVYPYFFAAALVFLIAAPIAFFAIPTQKERFTVTPVLAFGVLMCFAIGSKDARDYSLSGVRLELGESFTVCYPFRRRKTFAWSELSSLDARREQFLVTRKEVTDILPLPGGAIVFSEVRQVEKSLKTVCLRFNGDRDVIAFEPSAEQDLAFHRWLGQKSVADAVVRTGGRVVWGPTKKLFAGKPRWNGTTLIEISLRGSTIDNEQASVLFPVMERCDELAVLDLRQTSLSNECLPGLADMSCVPQILIEGSGITQPALDELIAALRRQSNTVSFGFLGNA